MTVKHIRLVLDSEEDPEPNREADPQDLAEVDRYVACPPQIAKALKSTFPKELN